MLLFLIQTFAFASDGAEGSDFSLMSMWTSSGMIAKSVIVILLVMLFWSILITIERSIAFNRARGQSMRLATEVVKPLQAADLDRALALIKDEQYKSSYLGAVLNAGLGELPARFDPIGLQNATRAVEKASYEEVAKMRRGMTFLATVGSTAPFVGLFGTTFGVINAFAAMGDGTGGLSEISVGIAEALITTGVGIGVAVIGVWMYNYFTLRTDKVRDELESTEADFLSWAAKLIQSRTATGK